jgi:hypothetical protein
MFRAIYCWDCRPAAIGLAIAVVVAAVSAGAGARADDLAPPDYRGWDNSVFVHWQNDGDPFNAADWELVDFQHFGPCPLTEFDNGAGPGQPTVEVSEEEDWMVLEFFVPNVVDLLPLK